MTASADDQARVSMLVRVPPAVAFRVFTEEIDQWWRRGAKYRIAGKHRSVVHIEGGVGGAPLRVVRDEHGSEGP